jgi:hypothetical protein
MNFSQFSNRAGMHLAVIAGAGIVLTLPVLILGIPLFSDDGVTHAVWYSHFSEQFWHGDLYPRWLMNMNGGLGSPVFFYYPPVPFFLTSFLRPLFANDSHGLHQVGISCGIALVASGISAYFWLKEIGHRVSAMVASILYMAMPYHLGEIYVRGAFAELWAFVWLPLILFFTNRIAKGRRFGWAALALSYALLVMTHLPTVLVFSAAPIAYVLLLATKGTRMKAVVITLLSLLLGVGLSGVYLGPALLTQRNVLIDRITTGYFSYNNWFLFSKWPTYTEDKVTMFLLVVDMSVIAVCAFLVSRAPVEERQRKLNRFWLAATIGSLFMMTELSKPLWWAIFPLQKMQFPWRFNVMLSISVAALLSLAICSLTKRQIATQTMLKIIAVASIGVWIPAMAIEAWRVFPATNVDAIASASKEKQIDESRDAPEYRPRWNQSIDQFDWNASVNIDDWDSLLEHEFDSVLQRVNSSDGRVGQIRVTARRPREIDLHVEAPAGGFFDVPQFYYPYWTAHRSGDTTNIPVSPSEPDGLLSLRVPPGVHDIQLRLERGDAEFGGGIVSLVCLAILTVALSVGYVRGRSRLAQ